MTRFGLVTHPESVTLVVVADEDLVLVRQPRAGAPESTLELPAGALEPGETVEEAAARELAEECGLAAASWRRVGGFWVAPAYSTEFTHVLEATGLSAAAAAKPDPDEELSVERLPAAEALGLLSDASSIAALALWRAVR